jgi:hypothetical protein
MLIFVVEAAIYIDNSYPRFGAFFSISHPAVGLVHVPDGC